MERVAVTGASGLVGGALVARLEALGHPVVRLVRRDPGPGEARWDPARGLAAPLDVDAVVHLAGESIGGGRWTERRRRAIVASRVDATRRLAEDLAASPTPPRTLVVASAVGFHGDAGDREVDESSGPGTGFLADVCRAWEDAAEPARRAGIRVVNARFGVVVSRHGGMLPRIALPGKLGLGGPLGSGEQWVSWVSLDDAVAALLRLVRDPRLQGPVAVVAGAVRQRDLAKAVGRAVRRPAVAPLPAFVVRAAFGQMGEELLLAGQKVRARKLAEAGFRFDPDLDALLARELAALPAHRPTDGG